MKKNYLYCALVILTCLSILLCGFWMKGKREHKDLETLCQYSAGRVYERFARYQQQGSEYDYHYGVSEMVSFLNSYKLLIVETEGQTNTNCGYLNQLVGKLMYLAMIFL